MEALKIRPENPASTAAMDDASLSQLAAVKLSLDNCENSDSDSGYDLGDGEEDASLVSTSLGGSLSSRSSVTGGSTESLHLALQQQQQQEKELLEQQQKRYAVLSYEQVISLSDF